MRGLAETLRRLATGRSDARRIRQHALGRMRSGAERILGSSLDIVPVNSLKPDVAERALAEAISL